jgi:hypothetical protein
MSDYDDARLPLKKDRQDIKLAKAAAKRAASGRNATLDKTLLPSQYGPVDNDPANYVHTTPPLVLNRPWKP